MKILLFATVLALGCMSLHAIPTSSVDNEKTETSTEKSADGTETTYITKTYTTNGGSSSSSTSSSTQSSSGSSGGVGGNSGDSVGVGSGGSSGYSYEYSSSSSEGKGGFNSAGTSTNIGSSGSNGGSADASGSGNAGSYSYEYSSSSSGGQSSSGGKFELTDEQRKLLEKEGTYTKTVTYHTERSHDCEDQLVKLNNDNDSLTRQLKSTNQQVTALTQQNTYMLTELESARRDYQVLYKDYTVITTEVKVIKSKIQISQENIIKLQAELNTIRSESLQCKSQYELIVVQLKQAKEVNIQLELNLKESRTTINNLQINIEKITVNSQNCGSEKDQWKAKFEAEYALRIAAEKKNSDYEAVISSIKDQNTSVNTKLERCLKTSNDKDVDINNFKAEIQRLKNDLSQCQVNRQSCEVALKKKSEEFDEDEKRDVEEIRLRERIEAEFQQLKIKYSDLEARFDVEIQNVANCKKSITSLREECAADRKKCQTDIENITIKFQTTLDSCQASWKLETEKITKINIEISQLNVRITEIKYQLDVSRKETEEAKKQIEKCNNENANLNVIIKNIKISIEETNKKLATCESYSSSLKIQFETSQNSLNICSTNLNDIQIKFKEQESIIIKLNVQIGDLTGGNKRCDHELNKLRCDIDSFFVAFKSIIVPVQKELGDVFNVVTGAEVSAKNFVSGHDLSCKINIA